MKNINSTAILTEERNETNDSLNTERAKTDQSFENQKLKAEHATDDTVITERLEADLDRIERRAKIDEAEQKQLALERRAEDEARKHERLAIDAALEREREAKESALNALVGQERKATDKNLMQERLRTDFEVNQSISLLNAEIEAHENTKSELTTREEFLAIVSHDLRNPIGTVSSSADILLKDPAFSTMGDDARHWIEIIKRNAETSLRLISDLLDMETIVEGKLALRVAEFDFSHILNEAIDSYSAAAMAKSLSLKISPSITTLTVSCDRDRVAQILSNLIGNAIKFTPEGGSVTLSVQEHAKEIEICVADTGPGIAITQQVQIFERFAQLANKDRGGLGLGLYISKTLVDSHQGRIWVVSSLGHGSKFCFTLPKNL